MITATDKGALEKLEKALTATHFKKGLDEGHFITRGLDVIFNDRGTYKIHNNQKEYEVESNPRWLEYDHLTDARIDQIFHPHHSNVFIQPINGYTSIDYLGRDSILEPKKEEKVIAKFHLSIDKADIPKAWNAIADYLVDNKMLCKVITPKGIAIHGDDESKPIVLYVTRKNIKDVERWHQELTDIESLLVANNIKVGGPLASDRPVEGSRFLHFRYGNTIYNREEGTTTKWDDDMGALNGGVDSFADLKINVTEEQAKRFQHELAANTSRRTNSL